MTLNAGRVTGVDTHAHVFRRDLALAAERRYAPGYDALPADYLAHLDTCGLSHGVLVQPSFLGTDNGYLLAAIAQAPDRLCGIAVVDPDSPRHHLETLRAGGVVGIRLNQIGRPTPDYRLPPWPRHLAAIAELGWQIEIQVRAAAFGATVLPLLAHGLPIVLDHLGLPASAWDADFDQVCAAGRSHKLWVKLSAPYRLPDLVTASTALRRLRDAFDTDRLLWGSDWPHTQHEETASYPAVWDWFRREIADTADRTRILRDNPATLYGF